MDGWTGAHNPPFPYTHTHTHTHTHNHTNTHNHTYTHTLSNSSMDGWADGWMDKASYRVASLQWKMCIFTLINSTSINGPKKGMNRPMNNLSVASPV